MLTRPAAMATRHQRRIDEAVLSEFILGSSYSLLAIIGARQPEYLLGKIVTGWTYLTAPAVRMLFAMAPISDGLTGVGDFEGVGLYRHILVAVPRQH